MEKLMRNAASLDFAEELVCVRLVDNIEDGTLKALHWTNNPSHNSFARYNLSSAKSRFTVHFSLNYSYRTYNPRWGGKYKWHDKEFGVLIPLESLIESGQKPVNLHHSDTFFLYEVKLTDDARILRQPNLLQKLDEGIKEMGFKLRKGDVRGWKEGYGEDKKRLRALAKKLDVTSKYHSNTIFKKYETLIGILENSYWAIDHWQSEHPDAIAEEKRKIGMVRQAYHKLKRMLPELPDKLKAFAEETIDVAKRHIHMEPKY